MPAGTQDFGAICLYDVRIFGYFSNWVHLFRLTLEICCLTLREQMDFVTEAMLCKVFRPGDGKSAEPPLQTGSYRESLEK